MKLMLSGIALLALLTACDDTDPDTDGNIDTEQDSGPSKPAADDEETTDEPTADDEEATDEPTADDEETADEPAPGDDAGGTTAPPPPPPPPEPISCGDVDCPAPPFGTPCCATAADVEDQAAFTEGACGVDVSLVLGGPSRCVEFDQPGEPDESCPAFEIPDADPIPGCCTSYGTCGTLDTFIGIGCAAPPDELGEPILCGGAGGDAGSSSSGGDAGSSSSGGDAGDTAMSAPDAGETSEESPDSGATSTPAQDASTMDASTDAGR